MASRGILALLHDRRGNVLPLAAIGMLLSAAIVGGGIDMSRAYRVQNRLQSACDSAALAGRRAVTTYGFANNGPEQAQANAYFNTNFDSNGLEVTNPTKSFTSPDSGQTVVGTASAELNTAVMKMFGFQKFTLSVNCSASMGVGNSDVMMVLDTTGSMSYSLGTSTRMAALQTAVKNFYTTVNSATAGTNARIRYGFVPFSSSVNVGRLLYNKNPSYLVDSWDIQSRAAEYKWTTPTYVTQAEYENETYTTPAQHAGPWNRKSKCNENKPADPGWQDNGSSTTTTTTTTSADGMQQVTQTTTVQPQTGTFYTCDVVDGNWYVYKYTGTRDLYSYNTGTSNKVFDYWNYKSISYDVSAYKKFQSVSTNTGSNGAAVSSLWDGCIEERESESASSFSFSTTSGITPSTALDLDIDLEPTSDNSTKWAPMWPDVAYCRQSSSSSSCDSGRRVNPVTYPVTRYGGKAGSYCPHQAQLLAAMTQSEFNAFADALYPEGSTYLDVGMVWGGRLSSPDGIFADNVNVAPSNGGEVSRHLIFMTDGDMDPNQYIQSSYGIEWLDRRVTDDGSDSSDKSRHLSRFHALCEAIKAKGIRVWTIAFTTGGSTDLQTCASPNSYYNANDSAELNTAFQEIAKQVGELRITQ